MEHVTGTFYCVGVGPGDPELITCKALNVLRRCPVIAAPRTQGGDMVALDIAQKALDLSGKELLSLSFPMGAGDREAAYAQAARAIARHLEAGEDVAMVNLGDVSIYSTCGHLLSPIREMGYETVMVPGVASFSAVAARLGISLTTARTPIHIIPASSLSTREALDLPGTKVLMKSGSRLDQVCRELEEGGALDRACLVSNCGLEGEVGCRDLRRLSGQPGYYTTIIVKE